MMNADLTTREANKALVRRAIAANHGGNADTEEIFAPNFVSHMGGQPPMNRETQAKGRLSGGFDPWILRSMRAVAGVKLLVPLCSSCVKRVLPTFGWRNGVVPSPSGVAPADRLQGRGQVLAIRDQCEGVPSPSVNRVQFEHAAVRGDLFRMVEIDAVDEADEQEAEWDTSCVRRENVAEELELDAGRRARSP